MTGQKAKAAERRRKNTAARNERLLIRFKQIYHVKRCRLDDAINELAAEFCLETGTVKKILQNK